MSIPSAPHICTRCGRSTTARYFLLGGQICNTCYSALRRHPTACPSCTQIRILTFIDTVGQVICATCAGEHDHFACRSCGSLDLLTGSHCGRCRLKQRLHGLRRHDGEVAEPLAQLGDFPVAAPVDPRSIVRWLRREPISRTLHAMATGKVPITHATIDRLTSGPRIRDFRRRLIDAGTLPPIPVLLHELNAFVDTTASQLPAKQALILQRFHRWEVLPRLHRRYRDRNRDITVNVFTNERSATLVRARLLSWHHQHSIPLADLRQIKLVHYIAGIKARVTINQFIGAAVRPHLAPDLQTYPQPAQKTPATISEEHLWDHTLRLLDDDRIELAVRIIGLFALVYAQPLGRSVGLTRNHVTTDGDTATVAFGATPVQLAHPVAEFLRRHITASPRRGFATGNSPWLFEGVMPGEHLTAAYIRLLLTRNGIRTRPARTIRVDLLARQIPASILADTIGVMVHTAEVGMSRADGTWSTHPTLRE